MKILTYVSKAQHYSVLASKISALTDVGVLQLSVQPFDLCEKSCCWVEPNYCK